MAEYLIVAGSPAPGARRAAATLEDLGWFVIDNLPPALIGKIAELAEPRRARELERFCFVVGRGGAESVERARARRSPRSARPGRGCALLFLDASDEVLVRRFEGTRRRHPLEADGVLEAIRTERAPAPAELREDADIVIDTSELNVNELRARLVELFAELASAAGRWRPRSSPSATSTGSRSTSTSSSTAASCRTRTGSTSCARSPGSTRTCASTSSAGPRPIEFLDDVDDLLAFLLPAYAREGKSYLSIAIGCTGGRHRSVAIAEELAEADRGRTASSRRCTTGTLTPLSARRSGLSRRPERRRDRRRPRPRPQRSGRSAATPARSPAVVSVADDGGSSGPAAASCSDPRPGRHPRAASARSLPRRLAARPCPRAPLRRRASSTGTPSATCSSPRSRRPRGTSSPAVERGRAGCSGPSATVLPGDDRAGRRCRAEVDGGASRGPGARSWPRAGVEPGRARARPTPRRPTPALDGDRRAPTRSSSAPARSTRASSPPSRPAGHRRGDRGEPRRGASTSRNLREQVPETAGYDVAAHVAALIAPRGRARTSSSPTRRRSRSASSPRRGSSPRSPRSPSRRRGPTTRSCWRRRSRRSADAALADGPRVAYGARRGCGRDSLGSRSARLTAQAPAAGAASARKRRR